MDVLVSDIKYRLTNLRKWLQLKCLQLQTNPKQYYKLHVNHIKEIDFLNIF